MAPLTIETAENDMKATQKQHKKDTKVHFTDDMSC
jgi:hypothetical protein